MGAQNKSGTARYASVDPLGSDCADCEAEVNTRMFCPGCREGASCNWCAGRGWRVLGGRWIACSGQADQ